MDEYIRLCETLESALMPKLLGAATLLAANHFQIIKIDCLGSLANLNIQSRCAPVTGWLHFQIHRTFGQLLSSERVFWMFVVCHGDSMAHSEPGRLQNLDDDGAVKAVVDRFTAACLETAGKTQAISREPEGGGPEDNQHKRSLQAASADPDV